ncbi:hypothetical protein T01_8747 [Trichinella spiralis]|nr:hypothetical protein T01_8747 [Trichinella spiralis]
MAFTMTRFIRPACLSDSYTNRTLRLKTYSPRSPPRTSITDRNSVTEPPSLLSPTRRIRKDSMPQNIHVQKLQVLTSVKESY